MADNTERSGGNNALYFIIGGLVVIAGIFIFLYTNGYFGGAGDVNVNVEAPSAAPAPDEPAAPAPAAPAPAPAQ